MSSDAWPRPPATTVVCDYYRCITTDYGSDYFIWDLIDYAGDSIARGAASSYEESIAEADKIAQLHRSKL